MPRNRCSVRRVLDAAVLLLALGCNAGTPASPTVQTAVPQDTAPNVGMPIRRLRRLSSREYNNVVRDLLGDTTQPANRFVRDVYQNGFDNGSAALAVQSDQVSDYESAAETLAATAVQRRMFQLLGGCLPTPGNEAVCVDVLISGFASRAFRRPLTDAEGQRLRDVFAAEQQGGASFERGVQTVIEVILQSPQFLYREELGGSDALAGGHGARVALTDYEVASELSFLMTGSMPDDQLWAAVQQGRFSTEEDHQREAARLLATQGARDSLRTFLHQWLATDQLSTISKDTSIYPFFSMSLAASMASELDQFFDAVLWSGQGSLRELFSSDQSFADERLDWLYGVGGGLGFQPVALSAQVRPGVLTRSGFLAAHADLDSSGPIARGVFVLQSIMCMPPPPPPFNPPSPPAVNDPSVKGLTTRQRFDVHASNPVCAACHTRIDGIGFGFEEFDGIGAYRSVDNGQPVDSSGTVIGSGEIDGDFRGAAELTAKLAGSRLLAACFAKQTYRYVMGQVESPVDDLSWLTSASTTDDKMTSVVLAIVNSPIFVSRAFE